MNAGQTYKTGLRAHRLFTVLCAMLLFFAVAGCGDDDDDDDIICAPCSDVAGTWEMYSTSAASSAETDPALLEIDQQDGTLTFLLSPPGMPPMAGTGAVDGQEIDFTVNETGLTFIGSVDNDVMSGSWTALDGTTGSWEAFRSGAADPVVMINLGDSLTHGFQSNTVNEHTQVHGFPQVMADQMKQTAFLFWENPLLDDVTGARTSPEVLPYNLGVSGATVRSLIEEQTGGTRPVLDQVFSPIPAITGQNVSQLEAAEYIAGLYPDRRKIFTLWIGSNDVLKAVTRGQGTQLTADAISAFLSDTAAGHDADTVLNGLTDIVNRLTVFPESHVFVATLPDVTDIAFLLNEEDLETLAIFPDADVTALAPEQVVGLGPFLNPLNPPQSIARALHTNNIILNGTVAGTIAASDGFSLTADEAVLLNERIQLINDHIRFLAEVTENVTVVDTAALFRQVVQEGIPVGPALVTRTYSAGGTFSLDGVHPSHTGYGLVANEFIQAINGTVMAGVVPEADVAEIWFSDPYQDGDGDGYVPGPALSAMHPSLIPLTDCDDTDPNRVAPYISGEPCL